MVWSTCFRAVAVFAMILAVLVLAGCQTPRERIVERVIPQRVEIPESLLRCAPEPVIRQALKTQRDVALFVNRLAEAGADCRAKLEAVRKLAASQ